MGFSFRLLLAVCVLALLDPALSNSGDDDVGEAAGRTLIARDATLASALKTDPAPTRVSSG